MTTIGVNVGDEFIREGIMAFLDEVVVAEAPLPAAPAEDPA